MSLPSIPSSTASVSAARAILGTAGDGAGPGGAQATAAALGTLAGRVAATIAQALALDPDALGEGGGGRDGGGDADDESGGGNGAGRDPYAVGEAADALARGVAAGPGEAGAIARALHGFVAEVAAMVGATPDARALDQVRRVVADASDRSDAGGARRVDAGEVLAIIDRATRALTSGLPGGRATQPAR